MRYSYVMPVSLKQFRTSLGKHAAGVSDEELQGKLNYMDHAADVMYAWWEERKEEPRHTTTDIHAPDMERVLEGIRLFLIRWVSLGISHEGLWFINRDGSYEKKLL